MKNFGGWVAKTTMLEVNIWRERICHGCRVSWGLWYEINSLTKVCHSYMFPLLRPYTKDAPIVRSFTSKKLGKNSIEVLLWEKNWKTERRFFLTLGAHKTLFSLKVESQDLRVVNPIWVIGMLLPSPTIISSLPPYSEWIERFYKS